MTALQHKITTDQQLADLYGEPVQAAGESGSFVADLVVRHRRFDDNGRPVGEGSDVSYTLTRQRRGGQWITSMDVRAPGLRTQMTWEGARALGPLAIARPVTVEIGERRVPVQPITGAMSIDATPSALRSPPTIPIHDDCRMHCFSSRQESRKYFVS